MAHPHIIIVAGGTGGHILPGLCIGEALQTLGAEVSFISGRRDIERLIYREAARQPLELRSSQNPKRFAHLLRGKNLAADFLQMMAALSRNRPAAALVMGGAVCFPVLAACRLLGIPYFLHESNAIPGRVVRFFASGARAVFRGLPHSEGPCTQVTGTPTRVRQNPATPRDAIVCVGGSQGAARLNELFAAAAGSMEDRPENFILIAGPGRRINAPNNLEVRAYEPGMPALWERALLAVTRAGAGTLADLAAARVPAILVPYPFAKDDHQAANARTFSQAGAAICIEESELAAGRLMAELRALLEDSARRQAMELALATLAYPDAAHEIARHVLRGAGAPALATTSAKVNTHGTCQ